MGQALKLDVALTSKFCCCKFKHMPHRVWPTAKKAGKCMSKISGNSFAKHLASLKAQPQESFSFFLLMFLHSPRLAELMTEEIAEEHIKL